MAGEQVSANDTEPTAPGAVNDPELVKCADCGDIVEAWIECPSTRNPGHDGIWADCPQCGVTGYDEAIEAGSCKCPKCAPGEMEEADLDDWCFNRARYVDENGDIIWTRKELQRFYGRGS